jgi:hypothetical protein
MHMQGDEEAFDVSQHIPLTPQQLLGTADGGSSSKSLHAPSEKSHG